MELMVDASFSWDDNNSWTPSEVDALRAEVRREHEIIERQADELAKLRKVSSTSHLHLPVIWTRDL